MHTGKRNQSFDYVMEGQSLEKSSTEKDLGVYLSCDLKSASHCIEANVKGNKMLGLVKRTVECYLLFTRVWSDRILNTAVFCMEPTLCEGQTSVGESTTSFHPSVSRFDKGGLL